MPPLFPFLRQVFSAWRTTGAVLPSSRRLARAITSIVRASGPATPPRRILEIGAGTGVFTDALVEKTGPRDRLVIYEMNPELAELLRFRRQNDPDWKKTRIEIREAAFPAGAGGELYDKIICGLPFSNFPVVAVKECFAAFLQLLAPGGRLAYFEYCHLRRIKMRMAGPKEYARLKRIDRLTDEYNRKYRVSRLTVARNIPPAWVHILENPKSQIPNPNK